MAVYAANESADLQFPAWLTNRQVSKWTTWLEKVRVPSPRFPHVPTDRIFLSNICRGIARRTAAKLFHINSSTERESEKSVFTDPESEESVRSKASESDRNGSINGTLQIIWTIINCFFQRQDVLCVFFHVHFFLAFDQITSNMRRL